MKRRCLGVFCVLFLSILAQATLTIHIQSPWRDDPSKEGYFLHILGSAGGGYNPVYGASSTTITTYDGDGWYTYTWDKTLADFQDWMNFNIGIYPNTDDQNYNNNNGTAWKEAGEIKMGELFGNDTELWLYTNTSIFSSRPPSGWHHGSGRECRISRHHSRPGARTTRQ